MATKIPTSPDSELKASRMRPAEYVTAEYATASIPGYKGNPFIEALPPIATGSALHDILAQSPMFEETQKSDSDENRYHHILGLMDFFQPLSRHFEFAQTIDQVIRTGYRSRNPKNPEFKKSLQESYRRRQHGLPTEPLPRTPPTCKAIALVGVSGGGKTDTVIRTLNQYPKVIYHPKLREKLWQIPWLRLECPHNGKISQLCYEFFAKVDERLGPNSRYAKTFNMTGINSNAIVSQINNIALIHGIGVIVIDELQNIKPRTELQISEFLNFLVNLVNSSIVPIVFVGTMACSELLQTTFRQARRAIGHDWQNYSQSEDWNYLMQEMWQFQWTKKTAELTDEILDVIYDETQGILDLAVKLFMFAQQRAIITGKEVLSAGLIKQVAADRLKMVRPMVEALRSGIPSRIAKFDDLSPLNFEIEWHYNLGSSPRALSVAEMKIISADAKTAKATHKLAKNRQQQSTEQPGNDAPPAAQGQASSIQEKTVTKSRQSTIKNKKSVADNDELTQAISESFSGTVLEQLT